MQRYQKKPIIVNAIQWDGTEECRKRLLKSCGGKVQPFSTRIAIETSEGIKLASEGDYIVKEPNGECYPLKSEIFELYHEKIKDGEHFAFLIVENNK
jgi:hypothetical protein